jgi:TctA family transporter
VTRRPLSESHLRTLLAAVLGAVLAGAYAHFVGCRTATCLITSSVWTAALYGGSVGAIVGWPGRPRRAPAAAERARRMG